MKISKQLLELLKSRKISIKTISIRSGVKNRTIEDWLYQGIMPTVDKAQLVLDAMGYKLEINKKED